MKIIPGPASPLLSSRVARILGLKIAQTTYKQFPDGELYVKIDGIDRDGNIVVQSLNSNQDLVYLILILEALEGRDVVTVIPYMGYARQDKKFNEGEAISIRAIAKIIESYSYRVLTVNIHSDDAKSYFKNIENIDAMGVIGEYYKGEDIVMISPDEGSYERVKRASEFARCEFYCLKKKRHDAERVEIIGDFDIRKKVVIVDDIISTGGTIIEAYRALNAKEAEAACVHAVLAGNALNRLYSAGILRVISTDTIEKQVSVLSVAELIAEKLKEKR